MTFCWPERFRESFYVHKKFAIVRVAFTRTVSACDDAKKGDLRHQNALLIFGNILWLFPIVPANSNTNGPRIIDKLDVCLSSLCSFCK